MGAWDSGILDDDVAADVVGTWEEYIVRGRARDPEFWTPEQILEFFESIYLQHRALGERDIDVALLAIGALFQRDQIELPLPFRSTLSIAASNELKRERLSLWDSPVARERVILGFLDSIGQKPLVRPRRSEADPLRTEIKKWEEFSRQYQRWVEISRQPFADQAFFDLVPEWFQKLQQFVGEGLAHDDDELVQRGKQYRLMHLAWYVGFLLQLPDAERLALIESASRVGFDSYIMPSGVDRSRSHHPSIGG